MVYKWASGSRIRADAQTAGEVCQRLESEGRLTPHDLVRVSEPEDAPLHDTFEWDDERAAKLYRETQARYIIRSLVVTCEDKEPTRAFVSLTRTTKSHEYHSINAVLRNADDIDSLLQQAYGELRAFTNKYRRLKELTGIITAIEKALP